MLEDIPEDVLEEAIFSTGWELLGLLIENDGELAEGKVIDTLKERTEGFHLYPGYFEDPNNLRELTLDMDVIAFRNGIYSLNPHAFCYHKNIERHDTLRKEFEDVYPLENPQDNGFDY